MSDVTSETTAYRKGLVICKSSRNLLTKFLQFWQNNRRPAPSVNRIDYRLHLTSSFYFLDQDSYPVSTHSTQLVVFTYSKFYTSSCFKDSKTFKYRSFSIKSKLHWLKIVQRKFYLSTGLYLYCYFCKVDDVHTMFCAIQVAQLKMRFSQINQNQLN